MATCAQCAAEKVSTYEGGDIGGGDTVTERERLRIGLKGALLILRLRTSSPAVSRIRAGVPFSDMTRVRRGDNKLVVHGYSLRNTCKEVSSRRKQ